MKEALQTIPDADTINVTIPPDRFFKSCHDTTPEGESIFYIKPSEIRTVFTRHQLNSGPIHPEAGKKYQQDWILGVLLLCFALLAWAQYFYRNRLQQVILSPFSSRFMNQLTREGNLFNERLSIALGIIYFTILALLIFETNELILGGHIPVYFNRFTFFLLIFSVLVVYWFIKILLISVLGVVFQTAGTTGMYLLNVLLLNIITGLILLPLMVLVIYLKSVTFLYFSLTIFLLSFVFLLIRGFFIGLSLTKFSYLFLFVYLCSLEILPLIIMIKLSLIFYNSMIM